MPPQAFLGCDLARYGTHWAVLVNDRGQSVGSPQAFRTTPVALERLAQWVGAQLEAGTELRVIVEPTGPATEPVQRFWRDRQVRVDCVIPLRVKRFRESYQSHTKPIAWTPSFWQNMRRPTRTSCTRSSNPRTRGLRRCAMA